MILHDQNWMKLKIRRFYQDGATCHTSRRSMAFLLREIFPNRLLSLRGDNCWPARSPDLNLCTFFLSDHLKAKVFSQSHETSDDLKDAILREVALIPSSMLRKVWENFEKYLESCRPIMELICQIYFKKLIRKTIVS